MKNPLAGTHPAKIAPVQLATTTAIFGFALMLHLASALTGWDLPILAAHAFRQTQTALSAHWLQEQGFSLAYATPVLGVPWAIPLEFPIYQGLVAMVADLGDQPIDQSGRLVSLLAFYAGLPALMLLLRRLGARTDECWLALALVLMTPALVFYSRTVLIETTAMTLGIWFLWLAREFAHRGGLARGLLTATLGIAAALAKTPTWLVMLPCLIVLIWPRRHEPSLKTAGLRGALAIGPGFILAAAWVMFSDRVKQANLFATELTSGQLREWIFGTWTQRLSLDFWVHTWSQFQRALLPGSSLLLVVIIGLVVMRTRKEIRQWISCLALAAVGPVVFANLYHVHDYYFIAVAPVAALLLAIPIRPLWSHSSWPLALRTGAIVVVMGSQYLGYWTQYRVGQIGDQLIRPPIAEALQAVTDPNDVIVGMGFNWHSALPYYSQRRALMIPDHHLGNDELISQALAKLSEHRIAALVTSRQIDFDGSHLVPWKERLDLEPVPMFSTGDMHAFVRRDMRDAAFRLFDEKEAKLPAVLVYEGRPRPTVAEALPVHTGEELSGNPKLAGFSPRPISITTPYGVDAIPLDEDLALGAHAPTIIDIPTPTGARFVEAQFGMHEPSYSESDGVQFTIHYVREDGLEILLFDRTLAPQARFSDRGVQLARVETTGPMEGLIRLRTLVGPWDDAQYDWAFWGKVRVY